MNKLYLTALATLLLSASSAMAVDDPMSGIPTPPDSNSLGSVRSIHEGGSLARYRASGSASTVLDSYSKDLSGSGWNIVGGGSGGSEWGGGGVLRATNGSQYMVISAGGPAGTTFIEVCVWPTKPHNTYCDD